MVAKVGSGPGAFLELFEGRLRAEYQKAREEEGVGFDPTIIIAILSAVLPLIAECFSGPWTSRNDAPVRLRDRRNSLKVAMALRKEAPSLSWAQAIRVRKVLHALADDATNEELLGLVADCCSA